MRMLVGCICIFLSLAFQQAGGYGVGDTVADFELNTSEGARFHLNALSNVQGCIVVFGSSTCSFATGYEERVAALDQKYKAQGYPVLFIDVHPGGVDRTFPALLDPEHKVVKQFGATRMPQAFVLKKMEERWVVKYIGAIDNSLEEPSEHFVQEAVDALLQNRDIIRTRTVALGCSIRSKR